MKTYLIGVGMGNPDTLTVGALRAIEESDLLIGAARLLEPFAGLPCEKRALVRADDIAAALAEAQCGQASVLLSGDVGFYSGATRLYDLLDDAKIEVIPGISSLSYFCAQLRTPWQDANPVSAHGRECDPVLEVRTHGKTFMLTGGKTRARDICTALAREGLGNVAVSVGERLSYDDERIVRGTAADLAEQDFLDLAVMLVENPDAPKREPGKLEAGI